MNTGKWLFYRARVVNGDLVISFGVPTQKDDE